MLLRPSQHSLFLFFFQLVLLSLRPAVHAVPAGIRRYDTTSVRRQNGDQPLSQPTTVTTVTHTNTPMGPATEICKITLTPIMPDGQPEVQEVKDCTFTLDNGSGDNGSGNGSSDGSSTGTSTASTFSSVATTSTFTSSTSSSDSSSTTAISSATTTASASPSANPAVIVNGVSSGPAVTPSPTSSSPSSSTSATSSASGSSLSSSSTTAATSAADSASSAASAASAAAANASSQAAFTLPGKKLSVLPIGLGVFAGISVIALIVVGLVTYERTKYRKAFRQRKLAEAGQGMGYGGMAERT